MIKMLTGNKKYIFPDFKITHGCMCVFGCYAPGSHSTTFTIIMKCQGNYLFVFMGMNNNYYVMVMCTCNITEAKQYCLL